MPVITNAEFSWSAPVTLNTDEIWQSRGDIAYLSTAASPGDKDGLALRKMEAIRLTAGTQVRYRKSGRGSVEIAREAVS